MSSLGKRSREELVSVIQRQQQEIDVLRRRVEILEADDVGLLCAEVEALNLWKVQAEEQIRELQLTATVAQGLVHFTASGILALLGEKALAVLQVAPTYINEEQRAELQEKLGDFAASLATSIAEIDGMSRQAWERQQRILELRAATLPPLKRALFDALDQLAKPSKFGTQLRVVVLETLEFEQKLNAGQLELFEMLVAGLDTVSNLWPLAAVNSLVPLLRYVGFDDAAEAAGEILDSLDTKGVVPLGLIHRIRPDLVSMGFIERQTKPRTLAEYLADGHKLSQSGASPDQAAAFGLVPSSSTHLKRAQRAYAGLITLYDRITEFPTNNDLDRLETISQFILEAANSLNTEQLVEAIPAKTAPRKVKVE